MSSLIVNLQNDALRENCVTSVLILLGAEQPAYWQQIIQSS
jgi:hypothetical protein